MIILASSLIIIIGSAIYNKTNNDVGSFRRQIYRNEKFGFEFDYPQNWQFMTSGGNSEEIVMTLADKNKTYSFEGSSIYGPINISAYRSNEKNLDQVAETYRTYLYGGTLTKTLINKQNGYVRSNYLGKTYFVVKDNYVYTISEINLGDKNIQTPVEIVFEKLLNSFNFTK